jgi:WD40 repeat protein
MLDAVLSPDGRWGATCNTEWARIVDPLTGKLVRQIDEDAWRVGFSPDSKWFVTVGRSLRLREVGSWALRRTITPATRTGISFAFSHDGSVLAYPISNSAVQLIDTTTWNELATLTVPTGYWVSAMCFSRDGCRLAVGSMSGAVQLWDLHLIRKQLAEMGLDWDAPPLKPAPPLFAPADKPLRVEVRALPRE